MFNKIDLDGGEFELIRTRKTQDTRIFNGKLSVTYRSTQIQDNKEEKRDERQL